MMAQVLVATGDLNREEWLYQRRRGIGGSDISAIAGMNKWRSPMNVYLEKIGESPETDENEAMYWGNVLEEVVAQEFAKRTDMKVRKRKAILQHPEYEFMLANVDRLIVGKKEGLECKTTSEYKKGDWSEEKVPDDYFLQCQWYMAVTGYKAWWIAVLIGGNKFFFHRIERDEELIQQLISIASDFWLNHVEKKVPPVWDGTDASAELLKALYPDSQPDSSIELPPDVDGLLEERDSLQEQLKDLELQKNEIDNKIKGLMGENEIGFSGERRVSWKTYESNRFDSKTFKKDHPDLFEKYINKQNQRRFMIS